MILQALKQLLDSGCTDTDIDQCRNQLLQVDDPALIAKLLSLLAAIKLTITDIKTTYKEDN